MNTDIAIVGGGIGGLYMGYKLQTMGYKNWAIFEASQRVGGKIHSNVYSDANGNKLYCEWGAMRFEWGGQPHLEKLIIDLDVELVDFPPFCGDRGWELELIEKICASLWKIFLDFHNIYYKNSLWDYLRQDNNYLSLIHQLGNDEWLPFGGMNVFPQNVNLSHWIKDHNEIWHQQLCDAEQTIRAFLDNDFNVMHWLSRWSKVLLSNYQIKTCKDGNETIIKKLSSRLSQDQIHTNYKLNQIQYDQFAHGSRYTLQFEDGHTVLASKLILAIPPLQLTGIDFELTEAAGVILNSLHGFKLGRVFVRVKKLWWNKGDFFELQNKNAEKLFAREVYYYTLSENEGVIMLYIDKHTIPYWEKFKNNEQYIDELSRLLQIDKNRIVDVSHKFWDGTHDVFAFQYLANDLNPHKVMHQLTSLNDNSLAIVGDSYSFDHGFIEGVLTSCHYCLENVFQKKKLITKR